MQLKIFDYREYKNYLKDWILAQPKNGHGIRSQLARALNSQTSHISQVLEGDSHFSLEQAEAANEFLQHNKDQAFFFLLLVELARAGSIALKRRISERLHEMIEKNLVLKNRVEVRKTLSIEDQSLYYSSWFYAAIHVLLNIESFRRPEQIAKRLNLSVQKVSEILQFLKTMGLVIQSKKGEFQASTERLYLGHDSSMIFKHHMNWRLQAIRSLEKENAGSDLHYSSVLSISEDDVLLIKSHLVKSIESIRRITKDSKNEDLHSFSLDFFRI